MPLPLEIQYGRILEVSQQMLAAGQAQEWDSLLELEKQRQSLFALLPTETGSLPDGLADTLREIQRSDRMLMEKVENWLQHAKILLRMPPESDVSS